MKYKSGYKYQLVENEYFHGDVLPTKPLIDTEYIALDDNGDLTIRAGYAWDGASGPAIQTQDSMRASLIHDAYYQLIRQGYVDMSYREQADSAYRRVCIEDGMPHPRAQAHYIALRMFGATAAMAESEPVVLVAP